MRAVAREVGLGDVLKLGRSEMMSGGRRKEALLADAMEAVIAAVYLDAGFEAARVMILRLWGDRLDRLMVTTAREDLAPPTDDDGRTFVIDAPGAVGRAEPRVVL